MTHATRDRNRPGPDRAVPPRRTRLAVLAVLFAAAPGAFAQDAWPQRPIRFIVTFPPGGGLDLVARIVASHLTERWGQQIVVDNRTGAGGTIGTGLAARAAPDGYTMLWVSSSHAINPSVHRKLGYDTVRDFVPVSHTTVAPHLLVVHPTYLAGSLKELLADAKARPGKITYASGGIGSSTHLAGELLKSMTGVDLTHVPYKGTGPAVIETIAGQVRMTIGSVPSVLPHVRAGRLKALALTAAKRSATAPEYPTIAEAGVPGFEAASWHGVLLPAGPPAALVARIQREIASVLALEEVKVRIHREGLDIVASTPQAFDAHIRAELARWSNVVKSAGIPVE